MKAIKLSFKSKDGVTDNREVQVSDEVHALLQKFMSGKKPTDKIFSNASSGSVNMLLKAIMPDITVKNLRTVKANSEFVEEAKRILTGFTPKTEVEKIRVLYLANKRVAEQLNHQKNIGKNHGDQTQKAKDKIAASKENAKKAAEIALGTSLGAYLNPAIVFSL